MVRFLFFIFSVFAFGILICSCSSGSVKEDRAALVALYNATNGYNWYHNTNWLSDKPLGEWHGVETNAQGRVTKLILENNQLSGPIPSSLGNLSNLETLYLHENQLSGPIPPELGNLSNLGGLSLENNQLSGLFRQNSETSLTLGCCICTKTSYRGLSLQKSETSLILTGR